MIISHSNKFVFIHIYKAAGTSIRDVLRDFNYRKSIKNKLLSSLKIYPKIFATDFDGHVTALQLKNSLPDTIFNSYYKFAFVRNPWAWQVSQYHFIKQSPSHHQHNKIKLLTFAQYLEWKIENALGYQCDFVNDEDGNLLVDFVGKVENISVDLKNICDRLKIPFKPIPERNKSSHKSYKEYYNDSTKKMIEEVFYLDIKQFNYTFDN